METRGTRKGCNRWGLNGPSGHWVILGYTGLYWLILGSYWDHIALYWFILVYTGPILGLYWFILVYTGI